MIPKIKLFFEASSSCSLQPFSRASFFVKPYSNSFCRSVKSTKNSRSYKKGFHFHLG
jgi:hypothetical protein